jgi:hypothetical protein
MIRFIRLHDWAVLPRKRALDIDAARAKAKVYQEHFRYVRARRQAEFCSSWVLGQEYGWRVHSPVDVTLDRLDQVEVEPDDTPAEAVRAAAMSEVWVRQGTALALNRPPWLHLYEFRHRGGWESMFIPNGQGTVEWRLGWTIEGLESQSVMVFPSEQRPDLGVQMGILTPATMRRLSTIGLSIAISPRSAVSIKRGDEIARVALVHPESLKTRAEGEEA